MKENLEKKVLVKPGKGSVTLEEEILLPTEQWFTNDHIHALGLGRNVLSTLHPNMSLLITYRCLAMFPLCFKKLSQDLELMCNTM